MYYFTADEHYGHTNIIKFCDRPYNSVTDMDNDLIARHNDVVGSNDVVVHVGDFTLVKGFEKVIDMYVSKLNGQSHIFITGSHDYWLRKDTRTYKYWNNGRYVKAGYVWNRDFKGLAYIVACHYAMRVWPRSHFNSCQVYGHSHSNLPPVGKQWDVGVDNNGFYPVSEEQLRYIMNKQPDNFNFIKR